MSQNVIRKFGYRAKLHFRELKNEKDSYRGAFSRNGRDSIYIDIPRIVSNSFSIFWAGNPSFGHLVDFVNGSLLNGWVSTTFFFPRRKAHFDPEFVDHVPREVERLAIADYADAPDYQPRFVRYEVYNHHPEGLGLPPELVSFGARFVAWAAISTPNQVATGVTNEIGIYVNAAAVEPLFEHLATLVADTIKPDAPFTEIRDTLKQAVEIAYKEGYGQWPAVRT